jgi:CubicO group peptidase (beta-lactamase class C family)
MERVAAGSLVVLTLVGILSCENPALTLEQKLIIIEQAIETARRAERVPGAVVGIIKDDSVVFVKGFGLRDVEAGLPVTAQTLFPIASVTKTFTALAAVLSAEKGTLSLDDSPGKFLPYFTLRDPDANAGVTLRDLLSHRTGVPDTLEVGWYERYSDRETLIRIAMLSGARGRFRGDFNYNNYMYLVAGEMIARSHSKTFERVLTDLVLKPLGMNSSTLSTEAMMQTSDFSFGYAGGLERTRVPLRKLDYLSALLPAGGVISSASDMVRWVRLMAGGGVFEGKRLVSEEGFSEMLIPHVKTQEGSYGLGLFIEEWNGRKVYFHHGGVPGFGSRFEFIPDQRLGLIVLTNINDQRLPIQVRTIVYSHLIAE